MTIDEHVLQPGYTEFNGRFNESDSARCFHVAMMEVRVSMLFENEQYIWEQTKMEFRVPK